MIESLYTNAWGAFLVMLLLQIPFLIAFFYVVNKKAFVDSEPGRTEPGKYSFARYSWLVVAVSAFFLINFASIKYMPTIVEANAATSPDVIDVHVTAKSWSYEISETTFEAGQTIRFLVNSVDTVHSFAVYHPEGKLMFTMMLVPGMETASAVVYTFTEPGEYTIRCLEYCGMAHHAMKDKLTVI